MNILKPEYEHRDSRRTLRQLFTANIKQVNFYDAKKGAILGDHFHKETIEYFYITKGTVLFNDKIVNRGTLCVVNPPERHTLECLTDVGMLTFLTKPFSKEEPDLWKK